MVEPNKGLRCSGIACDQSPDVLTGERLNFPLSGGDSRVQNLIRAIPGGVSILNMVTDAVERSDQTDNDQAIIKGRKARTGSGPPASDAIPG